MHTIRWVTLSGLLVSLVGGCGGSSSSNGPTPVDTGLPADKQLGQLTDAEVQQACERFVQAYTADFTPQRMTAYACTALSISSTQSSSTCQSQTNDCVSHPPSGLTTGTTTPSCTTANASEFAGCTATVSQMEQCLTDELAVLQTLMSKVNCSLAGNPQAMQQLVAGGVQQPASCQSIETRCPGATSGGSSGNGG